MELYDRENNVLELVEEGTSLFFQKDDYVINLGFDFYIVVHPINLVERYPHGKDTLFVMRYDILTQRTVDMVNDLQICREVVRRWQLLAAR